MTAPKIKTIRSKQTLPIHNEDEGLDKKHINYDRYTVGLHAFVKG